MVIDDATFRKMWIDVFAVTLNKEMAERRKLSTYGDHLKDTPDYAWHEGRVSAFTAIKEAFIRIERMNQP